MRRSAATLALTASRSTTAHAGSPGGRAGRAGAGPTAGVVSGAVTLIALQSLSLDSVLPGSGREKRTDGIRDGGGDVAGEDRPPWVGPGGAGGGPAGDVGGQRPRVTGRESCPQQRAEDPGEDVSGARRGEPGGGAPDAADGPPVTGDDERRRALEQDRRPGRVRDLTDAGQRSGLDVHPWDLPAVVADGGEQPGELARVRSEDG